MHEFLACPDESSASVLADLLESEKVRKMLLKLVSKMGKLAENEEVLGEVMKILHINKR